MLPERERQDLWETFVEDFNTCTLPHKKYYDLRAWEVENHSKKSAKASKKIKKEKEKGGSRGAKPTERDEDIRAREDAERRQQKASAEYHTELDAIALQHQAKEKEAMAKILGLAMAAKKK